MSSVGSHAPNAGRPVAIADGRQVEPNYIAHHPVIAVDVTDELAGVNEPQ